MFLNVCLFLKRYPDQLWTNFRLLQKMGKPGLIFKLCIPYTRKRKIRLQFIDIKIMFLFSVAITIFLKFFNRNLTSRLIISCHCRIRQLIEVDVSVCSSLLCGTIFLFVLLFIQIYCIIYTKFAAGELE